MGCHELLPGIPNDVTLDLIATKLSWKAFSILSSVSPAWQQAIKSRQVYDARVRSHSTEALVIVQSSHRCGPGVEALSLYSIMDENVFYHLPPIPGFENGFPEHSRYLPLDGKIYVLGGLSSFWAHKDSDPDYDYENLYELDLAGQSEWKQCARLQFGRGFGRGALLVRDVLHDEKIYVFGGKDVDNENNYVSVVYHDRKADRWDLIAPNVHRATAVREELTVLLKHSMNRHSLTSNWKGWSRLGTSCPRVVHFETGILWA